MNIKLKRAYDPAAPDDGWRVYIDRLWPRGLSHETFHYDLWDKDFAPSTELREWFHADPDHRWDEFARRYTAELSASESFATFRREAHEHPTVTLLFSSHDTEHNTAVVVARLLQECGNAKRRR